jgi:hypothetical protein
MCALSFVLTAEWEAAATNVPKSTRVVIIRTGIVLARDGGVLARMLPIFELFAGGFDCCSPTWGTWKHWVWSVPSRVLSSAGGTGLHAVSPSCTGSTLVRHERWPPFSSLSELSYRCYPPNRHVACMIVLPQQHDSGLQPDV